MERMRIQFREGVTGLSDLTIPEPTCWTNRSRISTRQLTVPACRVESSQKDVFPPPVDGSPWASRGSELSRFRSWLVHTERLEWWVVISRDLRSPRTHQALELNTISWLASGHAGPRRVAVDQRVDQAAQYVGDQSGAPTRTGSLGVSPITRRCTMQQTVLQPSMNVSLAPNSKTLCCMHQPDQPDSGGSPYSEHVAMVVLVIRGQAC
jgi:hypothetical protein